MDAPRRWDAMGLPQGASVGDQGRPDGAAGIASGQVPVDRVPLTWSEGEVDLGCEQGADDIVARSR